MELPQLTTPDQITEFLARLGQKLTLPADLFVFGGSALLLLGGRRNTADLDYSLRSEALDTCRQAIAEAAAVPVGGLEALHFIRKGNIQSGERVLINGAGGSIGTMAVQLAKLRGADVTAVDSTAKLDMLRSIGADRVIDYTQQDFTQLGQAYDVILDVVGKSSFSRSLQSLRPNGRYLLVNPGLSHRWRARWTSTGGKQVIHGTGSQKAEDLVAPKELIEAGKIRPVIDRQYPLEHIVEAHRYVDTGLKTGNVVVTAVRSTPALKHLSPYGCHS